MFLGLCKTFLQKFISLRVKDKHWKSCVLVVLLALMFLQANNILHLTLSKPMIALTITLTSKAANIFILCLLIESSSCQVKTPERQFYLVHVTQKSTNEQLCLNNLIWSFNFFFRTFLLSSFCKSVKKTMF